MSMLEYFLALDRLIKNAPNVVPPGTKITNDSVALEAGKGKGSIKKSRKIFHKLIEAITIAAREQEKKAGPSPKEVIKALKAEKENLIRLHQESLNRELLLLERLHQLESEIVNYKTGNVTNINSAKKQPLNT